MALRVVPWMTDDSVGFMSTFIRSFRRQNAKFPAVLEFGMGASTLYFIDQAARLVSYEHDPDWHARVMRMLETQDLRHDAAILAGRPYSDRLETDVGGQVFDIISIDGRDRVDCLEKVLRLNLLAENGILVLDNTERITTQEGRYARMPELLESDFNLVHFEQIGRDRAGWLARHRWITSISWRRNGLQFTTKGLPI